MSPGATLGGVSLRISAKDRGETVRATITIYLPQKHQNEQVLERLQKLAQKRDRSVNYLAVQAILEYLEKEEKKG
jgi:predicted transcriptional regulator